jgi:short-chain fatty acids transporter
VPIRFGQTVERIARRYTPDPLVFAVILTFVAGLLAIVVTGTHPLGIIDQWYSGFWRLLSFAMQMCLILVTGHALATAPAIKRCLTRLADVPRSQGSAIVAVTLVAAIGSLINWGLGIIVGSLFAIAVAQAGYRRGQDHHYPLLGAAAYAGFLCWHGGLSGSIPLILATPGHFLAEQTGVISTQVTLLSPLNLVTISLLLVAIPTTLFWLRPRNPAFIDTIAEVAPGLLGDEASPPPASATTPADTLETSRILSGLIGVAGLGYTLLHFSRHGFKLDLNIVNFGFLFLGIFMQGSLRNYAAAALQGAQACSGIIIQFPLYAGIMGIIQESGLGLVVAGWFVSISTATTFPVWAFLSAGLINLFVPSGGGQWAVQGPIMVDAAATLGVALPKTAMAVAYGDAWTNMLQPFWALALLGITQLKAGAIMGYTMMAMLVSGVIFAGTLLLL